MQYIVSFILIAACAAGLPLCILAAALLKPKTFYGKLFIVLLFFLFVLLLGEALIFFINNLASGTAAVRVLYLACRIVLTLFSVAVYFFLTGMTELTIKVSSARVPMFIVIAAGVLSFVLTVSCPAAGSETSGRLRSFDLPDILNYAVLLLANAEAAIRLRRIDGKPLKNVMRVFIILGFCLIPAALIEDVLFSRFLSTDIVISLPLWYLVFNGFLVRFGLNYVLRPIRRELSGGEETNIGRVSSLYGITPREREILVYVIRGLTNREIGETIFISAATVRNHLHSIFEKTGVSSRVELVRLCMHNV